ncbi:MAG TPA: acyl-CoA dehydrogenase family protein [Rhodothermales bacterium]|nr:acyl-CoA dehydrogenase family protein [Rhodothermales bacterium]
MKPLDFELTKEQKEIQQAAREFAKGEFDKELALELDEKHEYPTAIWQSACREGFIGLHFPVEYGGSGYGCLENTLVVEEFCRGDSTIGAALMLVDFASECILRFGSDELKARWLPEVAEVRAISGGAITEPDHGSDITTMNTTAVRDGDEWVVNGVKTFITNAGIAAFYPVICQTDTAAAHRGQSLFLVSSKAEGVEVADVGRKMGIRMIPTGEVSFKNVRIPSSNLVGAEGKGFYQILEFFDESRIETAAQRLGTAQGAFDRALDYVKQRRQFGKRIAEFQVTQHKIAEMATKLELSRLITYKAAWNFDQGGIDPKMTSMAKWFAAQTSVEVTNEAVQLHGGYGYIADYEVERFYRDAKITEIYEGTKEIQKNTIAGVVIGKLG